MDAFAAVELAIFLDESQQSQSIDPTLQSHGLNFSQNGIINITGHAWGQSGSVEAVEFRINDGDWFEATYSSEPGEVEALTPFLWHVMLNPETLPLGSNTVEIHSRNGEMHSLPVFYQVSGKGGVNTSFALSASSIAVLALVVFAITATMVLARIQIRKPKEKTNHEVMEAEIFN